MARLPVITGFGGINAAGRSSGHHGYRRMVIDALPSAQVQTTYNSLAALTGQLKKSGGKWTDGSGAEVNLDDYLSQLGPALKQGTLIRGLENNLFEPDLLPYLRNATLGPASDQALKFT
ncbi:MAG: beta-ketoacyl synthase, partial [Gammaproteobacteria bacterium]|nr:beta-ketoacyl synthase [Gammaproteobacteria bacterium]